MTQENFIASNRKKVNKPQQGAESSGLTVQLIHFIQNLAPSVHPHCHHHGPSLHLLTPALLQQPPGCVLQFCPLSLLQSTLNTVATMILLKFKSGHTILLLKTLMTSHPFMNKNQSLPMTQKALDDLTLITYLSVLISNSSLPHSLCFNHSGLLAILERCQAHSCLKTFAHAVPLPRMLPPRCPQDSCPRSFKCLLKCHLLSDTCPGFLI